MSYISTKHYLMLINVSLLSFHASFSQDVLLNENFQKTIINYVDIPTEKASLPIKIAIIDAYFDPYSTTEKILSPQTKAEYDPEDLERRKQLANEAGDPKRGAHHANMAASTIQLIHPNVELHILDLKNNSKLQHVKEGCSRIIAAIEAAIDLDVKYLLLSHRLSNDEDWEGAISPEMRNVLLKAADAGIGIINSAGNDAKYTGSTLYTRSKAEALSETNNGNRKGGMIQVAATEYKLPSFHEQLARYGRNPENNTVTGSNYAGMAHNFTISAPGKNNVAYGAAHQLVASSGTSIAAPIVVGVAAKLQEIFPEKSSQEILTLIRRSARTTTLQNIPLPAAKYGCGIPDIQKAIHMGKESLFEKVGNNEVKAMGKA